MSLDDHEHNEGEEAQPHALIPDEFDGQTTVYGVLRRIGTENWTDSAEDFLYSGCPW